MHTGEKLGRPGLSGDVIGCGLRRSCISLPTHPRSWSRGEAMTYSLRRQMGGDTQPCLKPCPITSPDRPGLPAYVEKTWEGLDTRLCSTTSIHGDSHSYICTCTLNKTSCIYIHTLSWAPCSQVLCHDELCFSVGSEVVTCPDTST